MRSRWLVAAAFFLVFLACCGKVGYDRWRAAAAIEAATALERRRDEALDKLVEIQFDKPVTLQAWLDEFTRQSGLGIRYYLGEGSKFDERTIRLNLPRQTARQALLKLANHQRFHWFVTEDLAILIDFRQSELPLEAWAHPLPSQFPAHDETAVNQLAAIIESRWPSDSIPVINSPGQLVVMQTYDVQLQVRQFLTTLDARLKTTKETPTYGLLPGDPRLTPLWVEPAEAPPAMIKQGLQRRMTLDVNDEPLHKVIGRIADAAGISIVLTKQVEDAGCHPDMPVTLRLRNVSVKTILNRLLGDRNLTCVVKDYVPELQVTTVADAWGPEKLITLAYPVADLWQPQEPGYTNELANLLCTLIAPDEWSDVGGPGVLCELGNTLLISQYDYNHQDLQSLLHAMRTVKAGERRSMRVRGISPEQERTFELLQQRRKLQFVEVPLEDALAAIERDTGLSIYLTKKIEDAGVERKTPITRDLPAAPLAENLSRLLSDLNLTYMVRDELVLITTIEDAQSPESVEIEVFDIRPILKKGFDNEVREIIWFGVQPDSWDRNGPDEFQGLLIVRQRQDVLTQVRYVLAVLERELLSSKPILKTENLLAELPFQWQDPPRTVMYDARDLIPLDERYVGGQKLTKELYEWPGDEVGLLNESVSQFHFSMRRFLVAYIEPEKIEILEARLRALRAMKEQSKD